MKARFFICYYSPDVALSIVNANDERFEMSSKDGYNWNIEVEVGGEFCYKYCVGERVESGNLRTIKCVGQVVYMYDSWRDEKAHKELYSSFYRDFVFFHQKERVSGSVVLSVECAWIKNGDSLAVVGSSEALGGWSVECAVKMKYGDDYTWVAAFEGGVIKKGDQYKFIVISSDGSVRYEDGDNRVFENDVTTQDGVQISDLEFRGEVPSCRVGGVAIPVFSLKSENSVGIGDFADLAQFALWTAKIGGRVVQILPINDTTITHTWEDSYPYKAISIYALHPLYLSLEKMGVLKDAELAHLVADAQQKLNALAEVDYEAVENIKWKFFKAIYKQDATETLESAEFKKFFKNNQYWLLPYSLFCHLRDVNGSAKFSLWGDWERYNEDKANRMISTSSAHRNEIMFYAFLQFHLDKQLKEVRRVAQKVGVALKGDIPIGISRDSVEAWVDPHLFNMNSQAGAPPDDFSVSGQNWGFPTYNWEEMAKDGYSWWKRRFRKMADYFDLYRIDHILGFFRIWQIPLESVEGLLGQFNPAMPFSRNELNDWGLQMDDDRFLKPFIHWDFMEQKLGKSFPKYKEYLEPIGKGFFALKSEYDTQAKIESKLGDGDDALKRALFDFVNDVLFVRDAVDKEKFHPRIAAHSTMSYMWLSDYQKWRFNELYTHFFYHRHNQFWGELAMKKLPSLIEATDMLCCAEDLGMIPDCVSDVLGKLQVITLEIERMPKDSRVVFGDTFSYPYLCVCTTSTHDMSTIRMFWKEGLENGMTQRYYNEVMRWHGGAPESASGEICENMVWRHLISPSILAILPLQDMMSIDENIRRSNERDERINVPANPHHYWRYRMHLSIEELDKCDPFNDKMRNMFISCGRL